MYTFKKVLAFALATLMICSCMVFTTFAADTPAAQATESETIVPISTCETTDGFTAGGSTGVVDTTDPWAGNASLATTFTGVGGGEAGAIKYQFRGNSIFDATAMKTLVFDIYLSDAAAFEKVRFEIELRGSGKGDENEYRSDKTLTAISGTALEDGWNHIEISIAEMTKVGNPALDIWNYFRIYNKDEIGIAGQTYVFKLDNVYMTSRDKVTVAGEDLIWAARSQSQTADGTDKRMWFKDEHQTGEYKANFSDVDGDGLNEWVLVNVKGDGTIHSQGGWTKEGWLSAINTAVLFTPHIGYSNMTALKFDLYIGNEILIDKKLSVELTSAGRTDHSEISSSRTLRDWFGDDLQVGWNTVEMPLSKFNAKNDGTTGPFVLSALNYIRIMSDDNFDFTGGLAMAICNIKAVRTVEIVEEIPLGETEKIKMDGATRTANIPLGENANNLALSFFVTNAENGYTQATADNASVSFPITLDMSDADKVYLDLYLENYEAFADVTGFAFEFSSQNRADHNEFSVADKSLSQVFQRLDGQPLQNGWNAVYSNLTLQSDGGIWKDCAGPSGGTYGNADPIDKTKVNYLRVYVYPDTSTNGVECLAALDNLRFVNTNMKDAPEFPEVKIKNAKLNLQDAFNIIYTAEIHETMKGVGMLFEVTDADGRVTRKLMAGQKGDGLNEVTFTYENIYPQNMTDNICTTLWAVNYEGKLTVDKVSNYSVKEYCSNMLTGIANGTVEDNDGTLATLLCDTLAYGAAVQQYIDYNTDNLATDGVDMSAATTIYAPPSQFPKLVGEQGDCPAEFFSGSAVLEDIFKLRITFKAEDITGLKLNFAPNTGDKIITFESDSFNMKTIEDQDHVLHEVYVVEIPIRPYERDRAYVITFEGYEDYMMIYSLGTYLASKRSEAMAKLEVASDPAEINRLNIEKNLYEATIAYGASARNYAASQH